LTFFRRGLTNKPGPGGSAWRVVDLYPAHFAVTDVKNRRFFFHEILTREGPGLAAAAMDTLQVRVKDWAAELERNQIRIRAGAEGCTLELALTPTKPVVLHGQSGYSRKSDRQGQASYYYSYTRLDARGTLTFDGVTWPVTGLAWMDHEFGSSLLAEDQAGWDWFSLRLDEGTELMVFRMRKKDGTSEPPIGTSVARDGTSAYLKGRQVGISPTGSWTSPHTKAVYPSGWMIEVADEDLKLEVVPLVEDQELASGKSTNIVYWEGAVRATGYRNGKPVAGYGYVELTGYAHSMAGRL
jgi:predicted secreted hydrolase